MLEDTLQYHFRGTVIAVPKKKIERERQKTVEQKNLTVMHETTAHTFKPLAPARRKWHDVQDRRFEAKREAASL